MEKHRIYTMSFAKVYPLYVAKAQRKGRTQAEVDEIVRWLTGYTQRELDSHIAKNTDFENFFAHASKLNPLRRLVKGVVCGVRVEEIKEPLMREIRYLDKLIDELAAGKAMENILRNSGAAAAPRTRNAPAAKGAKKSTPKKVAVRKKATTKKTTSTKRETTARR